jgi:exosome complex component RRP43
VCGIRAEILKEEVELDDEKTGSGEPEGEDSETATPDEEIARLGLLVPNFELSTGSTPQLVPGNAPSAAQQTLTTRIHRLLLSTGIVRVRDLRILYTPESGVEEGEETPRPMVKGYWTLYIDTVFISLDGNAFDAAWLVILAALRDTKLPHAYFDEELETILCSDDPAEAHALSLRGLPVPSTFAVFEAAKSTEGVDGEGELEDTVLADPDAREEGSCQESVCILVDCSGDAKGVIRKIEKSGGGVVDRKVMRGLVDVARERWEECQGALLAGM